MKKTLALLLAVLMVLGAGAAVFAYSEPTVALENTEAKTVYAAGDTLKLKLVVYNQSFTTVNFALSFPTSSLALVEDDDDGLILKSVFGSDPFYSSGKPERVFWNLTTIFDAVTNKANGILGGGFSVNNASTNTALSTTTGGYKYVPAASAGYIVTTISFNVLSSYTLNKSDFAFTAAAALGAPGGNGKVYLSKPVDGGNPVATAMAELIDLPAAAPANTAPKLKAGVTNPASASIDTGSTYTSVNLSTIFEDAENNTLSYKVSTDGTNYTAITGNTYTSTAYTSAGNKTLKFKANDGTVDSTDIYTVNITVLAAPPVNTAPARKTGVGATATSSITLPNSYSLNLGTIFADADNDALSYQIKLDSATDFSNVTGSAYTNSTLSAGTHTLVFRAFDGTDYSTETYTVTLTVNAAPINHAPKLKPGVASPATASVNAGSAYSLNLADIFTDEDNNALTYKVSIDSAAAASTVAMYSKTWNSAGTYSLSFTANDGSLDSVAYVVNVTVNAAPANNAPTRKIGVSASANAAITLGQTYSLNLADIFTDSDNDSLSYKVKIGSGNAMNANASYSYNPTIASSYTLVFMANDGKVDSSDTYTVNLTVNPAAVTNTAPVVSQSAPTSASITLGESHTIVLSSVFSDAQNDALTYKLRIGSSLQSTIVSSPYVFTPTAIGSYVLHFTASDASLTSSEYSITITVNKSNADALADAKLSASNELDSYIKDYGKYTDEAVVEMKRVIAQAKIDIELADSTDAVSNELAKAKTQLNKLAQDGAKPDSNVIISLSQLLLLIISRIFTLLKILFGLH